MKRTKIQRGPTTSGSASLGSSQNRYAASKKLAEEAKEATKQAVAKVNTKKQNPVIINPEQDIVGSGTQQQST